MALSGLVAGRFAIQRPLASGGMGRLHLAIDRETGSEVALKELAIDGADAVGRFEREAVMLSAIDHPNIVKYITHGEQGGQWYLVMDLVRGEPLSARIHREGLTVDESLAVGRQLASALHALHRQGLVHRDIKPPNLMVPVGAIEPLTLVDFGLVRRGEGLASLTKTGVAVGSPGYMSPEQARGDRSLSPAVDIYALGCVLYVSLTGHQPFPGQHALAVQAKILAYEPPPPHVRNPECPEDFSTLVMKMLSQNVAERPQTGADLVARLESLKPTGSTTRQKLKVRASPARYTTPTDSTAQILVRAPSYAVGLSPLNEEESETIEHTPMLIDTLRELSQLYSANLAMMKDGTCAFVSKMGEASVERAMQGCQLAVELVRRLPDWVVSLALGGEGSDEVIDRALQLLAAEQMNAFLAGASGGARIDDETARRLGQLGEIVDRQGKQYLIAIRL